MFEIMGSENKDGLPETGAEGLSGDVKGSLGALELASVLAMNPQAAVTQKRWAPDVQNIAVLRANAIGDFIFALSALQSLRAAYPMARITYYGPGRSAWPATER